MADHNSSIGQVCKDTTLDCGVVCTSADIQCGTAHVLECTVQEGNIVGVLQIDVSVQLCIHIEINIGKNIFL